MKTIDNQIDFCKRLFTLLFIILVSNAFGQAKPPTKKQLIKIFDKSVRNNRKDDLLANMNSWLICNMDSSFYKTDTLRVVNNSKLYTSLDCCNYLEWKFFKKDLFASIRSQNCNEPANGSAIKDGDWYKVEISENKEGLMLKTFNRGVLSDMYKVISINTIKNYSPNNLTTTITMIRVKI